MGQDYYTGLNPDGSVDTSWMGTYAPAPVYGPPAPTPEQVLYDQTVTSGSTPNPFYNYQPYVSPTPAPGVVSQIASALTSAPSRPSPTVAVPLSMSSIGMFFTGSTLISGIPNIAVLAGGAIALSLVTGMLSGKRRRR